MPVKIAKMKSGGYQVSTPGGVKAKNTTLEKAKGQQRLLNAIDHNPEFAAMIKAGKGRNRVARPKV